MHGLRAIHTQATWALAVLAWALAVQLARVLLWQSPKHRLPSPRTDFGHPTVAQAQRALARFRLPLRVRYLQSKQLLDPLVSAQSEVEARWHLVS